MQNTLLSAYGLSLRSRRYGGVHQAALSSLRQTQWLPAASLRRLQLGRANAALESAAGAVPWYKPLRNGGKPALRTLDQLRDLPTVGKDDVRRHLADFVSDASRKEKLLEVHTGGTTGTPLTIYCDRPTLQLNYAFFARLREWAGVPNDARVATFAGRTIARPDQTRPPYWRHNAASRTVLY